MLSSPGRLIAPEARAARSTTAEHRLKPFLERPRAVDAAGLREVLEQRSRLGERGVRALTIPHRAGCLAELGQGPRQVAVEVLAAAQRGGFLEQGARSLGVAAVERE